MAGCCAYEKTGIADKKSYSYKQIHQGRVRFTARTEKTLHFALTLKDSLSDPRIEISIGGDLKNLIEVQWIKNGLFR